MAFSSSSRTLWVGDGERFTSLHDAIEASGDGDTIYVHAGVYRNDFSIIDHDLRIVGVDGRAHLQGTRSIDNGKGILDIEDGADVIIENMEFSGAHVGGRNGSGIRHHGGDLVIRNSYFHDNENGILAGDNDDAHVTIDQSEFRANGSGDGYTHGVYVNRIGSLTVTDSYFHETNAGHHIKSRAYETTIETSRLIDGDGSSTYSIDMPNGGHGTVRNNYIEQGWNGINPTLVNFGGEDGETNPGDLWVENNSFVNYRSGESYGIRNWTDNEAHVHNNTFDNIDIYVMGENEQTGNHSGDGDAPVGDWMFS